MLPNQTFKVYVPSKQFGTWTKTCRKATKLNCHTATSGLVDMEVDAGRR